jgi:hypothetical protein
MLKRRMSLLGRRIVEQSLELYTCSAASHDSEMPAPRGNATLPTTYNELATLMSVTGDPFLQLIRAPRCTTLEISVQKGFSASQSTTSPALLLHSRFCRSFLLRRESCTLSKMGCSFKQEQDMALHKKWCLSLMRQFQGLMGHRNAYM